MSLTARLIWYIEKRLNEPLSLTRIARANGVSAYYATRLFQLMCGQPLMSYVRARRLSVAAQSVREGADIMDAALQAGYASHEAFSRAFRQQFGVSPKALRQPDCPITLTEPVSMSDPNLNPRPMLSAQQPRIETRTETILAGPSGPFEFKDLTGIPALWQRLDEWFGSVPGQVGGITYGASYNFRPDGFEYLAGVEIDEHGDLPEGFSKLTLPAGRYAVYAHNGHVSAVSHTWRAIYDEWLPASGLTLRPDPVFERMDERFDGNTGTGLVELWLPIA